MILPLTFVPFPKWAIEDCFFVNIALKSFNHLEALEGVKGLGEPVI